MICLIRSETRLKGKPKNPPASDFGIWLDAGMERRGWSIRELADVAGVSQPRITQLRQGGQASRDMVKRLAMALSANGEDGDAAESLLAEGMRAAGFAYEAPRNSRLRDLGVKDEATFSELDPEDQELAANFIQMLLERRQKISTGEH